MIVQFGVGAILVNPLSSGNNATPSGPGQFLTVQDCGVEFSTQLVPLKGQSQYPDDVAIGDKEIKGTGSTGRLDPLYFNSFMLGDTITIADTTATQIAVDEAHPIPATSTYTVVGTKTTVVEDLGVRYSATNQPLEKVVSVSAVGQYSVAVASGTITYTFYSGDAGLGVLISYSYTATAQSLAINNHPMGYGPTNEMFLQLQYACPINTTPGKNILHLFTVKFSNWGLPQKRDGYVISKFDFMAYPNAAGNVAEWIAGDL
jgi:hypothetical protein